MADDTKQPAENGDEEVSKRERIHQCTALKEMPRIHSRMIDVWGRPEFFEYVDSLLLMEPGRENRSGLPFDVYREIDMLERLFLEYPDEVMDPTLNARERQQIHNLIRDRSTRINYTTGDRR